MLYIPHIKYGRPENRRAAYRHALSMINILEVAQAAGLNPRPNGSGLAVVRCPFHSDSRPSLLLGQRSNMWRCQAGCYGGEWHLAKDLARELGVKINSQHSVPAKRETNSASGEEVSRVLGAFCGLLDRSRGKPSIAARQWVENKCLYLAQCKASLYLCSHADIRWLYETFSSDLLERVGFGTVQKPALRYGMRDILIVYRSESGHPIMAQMAATSPSLRAALKYQNLRGRSRLFGQERLNVSDGVVLCEGTSDALAFRSSTDDFRSYLVGEKYAHFEAVAAPSAMTFIKSWANSLAERFVIIAYDNDDAGRLGAGKVARALKDAGGHGKIITVGEPGDDIGSLWQRWPK